MKQAKAMQEQMKRAQEEAEQLEIIGSSGGGMVKIVMNGRHQVKSTEIDPSVVLALSEDDRKILEDLIGAAINDASKKIQEKSKNSINNLMGNFNLPLGLDTLIK